MSQMIQIPAEFLTKTSAFVKTAAPELEAGRNEKAAWAQQVPELVDKLINVGVLKGEKRAEAIRDFTAGGLLKAAQVIDAVADRVVAPVIGRHSEKQSSDSETPRPKSANQVFEEMILGQDAPVAFLAIDARRGRVVLADLRHVEDALARGALEEVAVVGNADGGAPAGDADGVALAADDDAVKDIAAEVEHDGGEGDVGIDDVAGDLDGTAAGGDAPASGDAEGAVGAVSDGRHGTGDW